VAWDFETDPEFEEHLQWMRRFIDEDLIPLEPIMEQLPPEEWAAVKAHLQGRVKERGLWGAFLDPALGGPGFGQMKLALMSEIIGRCMMSMSIFGVQAPDSGNMELLAHGATPAQKERWLWPNLRGEISSAFALTEPFLAGSDPTVIGTTAVLDGDEWVIDGHKWFITNASVADIVLVVAETNPSGRPHRHASILVVPAGTPGMEIVRDVATMGHPGDSYGRVGNHAEILFRGCRVPADHLIGQPGDGFVLAQQRLGGGRIHHAMRWLGQAQRSLDIMCERAVSRTSHGKLLAQHQMIQDYVAISHMEIQAARLLTFQTAWRMDRHGASAVRAELGMVKAHVSKVVLAVLDRTIQVCGALGYSADLPVESWYRVTRFGPIGDGPDELHKSVLARTLLKGYKPVEGWPTEHIPTRVPAAWERWGELRAWVEATLGRGGPLEVAPMPGGGSCDIFSVRRGEDHWVLRRAPVHRSSSTAHDVLREFRILDAIKDSGVPLARPVASCDDPNVFGGPFYLMDHVPGVPVRSSIPASWTSSEQPEALHQLIDALALIHAVDPPLPTRPGPYLPRQTERWLAQLASYGGRDLPVAAAIGRWLTAHLPPDQPAALAHGDYKLDNVLYAPEGPPRLLAVVDWEMASVGDPLVDLAWALIFHPGPEGTMPLGVATPPAFDRNALPGRDELVARYASATGRDVSRLDWYDVFARWKLAIVLEGSYAKWQRGESHKPVHEYFGSQVDLLLGSTGVV
jgi:alkylation response protein AidB-like acyl-CoA dehydrogenase/aminoglycoside phosphotransferase (APT) family kinase protein